MRLKVIYNPAAGRGRARQHVAHARDYLTGRGMRVECESSASPEDLVRIAAESSRADYDRVVVCGGDGTLHLAIRAFDLKRGTIGVVPMGSGNDFAKVLGIPLDIQQACDVVIDGRIVEVDVALANGIRYLGVAGIGFDSAVAEYARRVTMLRGPLVYLYSILRVLPRFVPRRVALAMEGTSREMDIMFAAVANTSQYGGGIRIAPDARIDDGLLDLCIVHRTTRRKLLLTLPKAYRGAHVTSPFVEILRSRQFHFSSEASMPVYADGEPITTTPVSFSVAEEKLRVVGRRDGD